MQNTFKTYYGGGKKKISKDKIRKMLKNMRRAPHIQAKAQQYHIAEEQQADKDIEKSLETI